MNLGAIIFVGIAVYMIVFGAIGCWIAGQCGREAGEGALLGALLGPLGLIIEGLLPKFPFEKQVRDASSRRATGDVRRSLAEVEEWHKTH